MYFRMLLHAQDMSDCCCWNAASEGQHFCFLPCPCGFQTRVTSWRSDVLSELKFMQGTLQATLVHRLYTCAARTAEAGPLWQSLPSFPGCQGLKLDSKTSQQPDLPGTCKHQLQRKAVCDTFDNESLQSSSCSLYIGEVYRSVRLFTCAKASFA